MAIMNCWDELCGNLDSLAEIEKTSMIVNNSMTNEQQRLAAKRINDKRKEKEMKLKIVSRGCVMRCEQWPQLAKTLEYIFNTQDVRERAGGSLEAHSWLKTEILFSKLIKSSMQSHHHLSTFCCHPATIIPWLIRWIQHLQRGIIMETMWTQKFPFIDHHIKGLTTSV